MQHGHREQLYKTVQLPTIENAFAARMPKNDDEMPKVQLLGTAMQLSS